MNKNVTRKMLEKELGMQKAIHEHHTRKGVVSSETTYREGWIDCLSYLLREITPHN